VTADLDALDDLDLVAERDTAVASEVRAIIRRLRFPGW
jgi:hypothetical protein